uniref:Uncharacterized protein n=1 Tax=Human betaherpesvirus 6 TaxID=10368 RepID=A0A5P9TPV7_9BETA|nr:hypothetical protein [Human betaherpesvirus 6]
MVKNRIKKTNNDKSYHRLKFLFCILTSNISIHQVKYNSKYDVSIYSSSSDDKS